MATYLAYAEVLTSSADALEPAIMLSVEQRATYGSETQVLRRYLFDVPEEMVRFCGSHQLKLAKVAAAFVTSGRGSAGLAELLLTASQQGTSRLHVRGPVGTAAFTHTVLECLAGSKSLNCLVADAKPESRDVCYEDDWLQVWPISVECQTPMELAASKAKKRPKKRQKMEQRAVVGYKCRLRLGGASLVVVPKDVVSHSVAEEEGEKFVFHLGKLPSGAGPHEVGVVSQGRRRGLWKCQEHLCRWRTLVPWMVQARGAPKGAGSQALAAASKKQDEESEPILRAYIWPTAKLEAGTCEDVEEEAVVDAAQKDIEAWGLKSSLDKCQATIGGHSSSSSSKAETNELVKPPELLFLGTGSAKPTSKRGQSAILAYFRSESGKVVTGLLDCGGGTWATLVRLLGETVAAEVIDNLHFIWISHHHADHCAGLPTVIWRRKRAGLKVVAPDRVQRFWRSAVTLLGAGFGGALSAPAFLDHSQFMQHKELGSPALFTLQSVPVQHCQHSYALVIRTKTHQVVYSGDCRPSSDLVAAADSQRAGRQTWLIHEGTFDAEEQADAEAKRHSTIQEACKIARQMEVKGVVLTHFSQRYPSLNIGCGADGDDEEGDEALLVCAAFDGLRLPLSRKPFKTFAAVTRSCEEFWRLRHERAERERHMLEPRQPIPGKGVPKSRTYLNAEKLTQATAARDAEPAVPLAEETLPCTEMAESAASDTAGDDADLATRLRHFYLRFNPEKAEDAEKVARLFSSEEQEQQLNAKLRARYGDDLKSFRSPAAGASERSTESDDDDDDVSAPGPGTTGSSTNLGRQLCEMSGMMPKSFLEAARKLSSSSVPSASSSATIPAEAQQAEGDDAEGCEQKLDSKKRRLEATLPGALEALVDLKPPPAPPPAPKAPLRVPAPPRRPEGRLGPAAAPPPAARRIVPPPPPPGSEPVLKSTMPFAAAKALARKGVCEELAERSAKLLKVAAAEADDEDDSEDEETPEKERQVNLQRVDLERRLRKFYLRHNPEKAEDAAKVARLFLGKEEELNKRLRDRYSGDDLSFCAEDDDVFWH